MQGKGQENGNPEVIYKLQKKTKWNTWGKKGKIKKEKKNASF